MQISKIRIKIDTPINIFFQYKKSETKTVYLRLFLITNGER